MTEEGARTRWMFRLWVILAVLGVVPNTSVAEPAGGQIVRLIPSTMPPSRTYCVLEDADGTFSSTVDWDPLVPRALIRDIRVPGRLAKARPGDAVALPKSLLLTCYSEAIRPTIQPTENLAWEFCDKANPGTPSGVSVQLEAGARAELVACGKGESKGSIGVETKFQSEGDLGALVITTLPPAANVNGLRAFGLPDESAVNEIFQAIAEVVIEKARSRGMRVLEKELLGLVCDSPVAFVHTCEALRSLRLDDLASSGTQLVTALTSDLIDRVELVLPEKVPLRAQLLRSLRFAVERGGGTADHASGAGVKLLLDLLEEVKKGELKTLASIIVDCNRSGACSLDDIRQRLASPQEFYGQHSPGSVVWPQASTFVSVALKLLQPSAGTTEAEQLRASVGLLLDYTRFVCGEGKCGWSAELAALSNLVGGILERDVGRTLVAGVTLVEAAIGAEPAFVRLAKISGALGSFLSLSTSGRAPSEAEQKERREARKSALSSLIDEFGDRSHRAGDAIFSIGSEVFLSVGYKHLDHPGSDANGKQLSADQAQATPVSLNLGFAFDWSSSNRCGLHIGVFPFDLGGYLTLHSGDEVVTTTPGDILRPSVTLGWTYLVPDANMVALIGATAGYQTKFPLESQDPELVNQSGFYLGLAVGMYLPIFDFN